MDEPVELTDDTFNEIIKENSVVVVDCWAPWCGPCRMIAPVVEELAREYAGKIVFGKLNVDLCPETSARFGIMSIPTLLVMKDGEEVDRLVGLRSKEQLVAQLDEIDHDTGARKPGECCKLDKEVEKMDEPVELTDDTFNDIIKENSVVVVDCWAPWCGPCRMIAPVVEELALEYAGKIVFGKLNVDVCPGTSARFSVMSIPTLLVMKDGEEVDRLVGFRSKEQLVAQLEEYL